MIGGTVRVDASGLEAIEKLTKQRGVTLKAVKAGAKIVLAATKAAITMRDTGLLKKSQGTKAAKGKGNQTGSYAVIGARRKTEKMVVRKGRTKASKAVPAFYDHLVRLGTKAHSVGKGQSLGREQRISKSGKKFGKAIAKTNQTGRQHPGTKGNDFRLKGWEASKQSAGAATIAAMGSEVSKAIAEQSSAVLAKLGGR